MSLPDFTSMTLPWRGSGQSFGQSSSSSAGLPAARPTAEEVRRHRAARLPFRDWCPECVAGAANDWLHRARETASVQVAVPEVHVDYCFPKWRKRRRPRSVGLGENGYL